MHKPGVFFIVDPWMSHIDFRAKLLINLQYKLFSFNDRDDLLHNLWGICDNQINHIVISTSDQHNSFTWSLDDIALVMVLSCFYYLYF